MLVTAPAKPGVVSLFRYTTKESQPAPSRPAWMTFQLLAAALASSESWLNGSAGPSGDITRKMALPSGWTLILFMATFEPVPRSDSPYASRSTYRTSKASDHFDPVV